MGSKDIPMRLIPCRTFITKDIQSRTISSRRKGCDWNYLLIARIYYRDAETSSSLACAHRLPVHDKHAPHVWRTGGVELETTGPPPWFDGETGCWVVSSRIQHSCVCYST